MIRETVHVHLEIHDIVPIKQFRGEKYQKIALQYRLVNGARKQVSDTLKSILPTKHRQISLLRKNTRNYKYPWGSSLFYIFVFNKT